MNTFPVMLVLQDRLAVVVGGGGVGLRKLRSLRDAGCRVRLVTPTAPTDVFDDGVDVVEANYAPEHLEGADIVFACTSCSETNDQIARDARERRLWVNAADQPEACDFYMPAIVRRGNVVLAVGTGGASPGLVQHLKRRADATLPDGVGDFAALLDGVRKRLKAELPDEPHRRMQIMNTLSDEAALDSFVQYGPDAITTALEALLAGDDAKPKPATANAKRPAGRTLLLRALAMTIALVLSVWVLAHATSSPGLLRKGHILAAMHAAGGIVVAALAGLYYLRTEKQLRQHSLALFEHKTASLETLQSWIRRGFVFAMVALSISLPLGLLHAHSKAVLMAKWTARDYATPKLIGAFAVWGLYSFAVVLTYRPRFRARQCAKLALAGLALTLLILLAAWLSTAR